MKDWTAINAALEARLIHKVVNGVDYYRCQ